MIESTLSSLFVFGLMQEQKVRFVCDLSRAVSHWTALSLHLCRCRYNCCCRFYSMYTIQLIRATNRMRRTRTTLRVPRTEDTLKNHPGAHGDDD